MANKSDLEQCIKKNLKDWVFIITSNHEPYVQTKTTDGIKLTQAAGGAHTLLDVITRSSIWKSCPTPRLSLMRTGGSRRGVDRQKNWP